LRRGDLGQRPVQALQGDKSQELAGERPVAADGTLRPAVLVAETRAAHRDAGGVPYPLEQLRRCVGIRERVVVQVEDELAARLAEPLVEPPLEARSGKLRTRTPSRGGGALGAAVGGAAVEDKHLPARKKAVRSSASRQRSRYSPTLCVGITAESSSASISRASRLCKRSGLSSYGG